MFPLESLVTTHRELGLLVALGLGVFFGFVLERSGFGTAHKLTGQFYLHDMTVFKVMFSAIVTAMLGLVLLGAVGVVDSNAVLAAAASETFLWPMLLGGFVLGVGFIVSGYCPGTSLVAAASGKVDGLFTVIGVVMGSVVFGFMTPLWGGFAKSGAMGQRFLDQITGIPRPILAMAVALMAVAMFFGAERVEALIRGRRGVKEPDGTGPRGRRAGRLVFAGIGAAALVAATTMALPGAPRAAVTEIPPPVQPESAVRCMEPAALARILVDAPWRVRILDLRDLKACAEKTLPLAECVGPRGLGALALDLLTPSQDLVLVGPDAGRPAGQRKNAVEAAALSNCQRGASREARLYRGPVFVLAGGFAAWSRFALHPPSPPPQGAPEARWEAYRFQAAYHQAMTGRATAPAVSVPTGAAPARRAKKKGGCS